MARITARAALLVGLSAASTPAVAVAATPEAFPPPVRRETSYIELHTTAFVGDGLRFDDPYRLATPLGGDAESVSRSALYADLGLAAMVFGDPLGIQHGPALRFSIALEGIHQTVLAPSYVVWRRWRALAAYGRLGVPIVLSPDKTWGYELGLGGVWFVRAGIGIAAELVGGVFYGAGTRDVATAAYPMLSAQAGLLVPWEILP